MDYEALNAEMNNLLKLMSREGPGSEKYEDYTKRLGELQQMAIKRKELELTEAKQKEEAALKRRELVTQEEEIQQRSKNSKRESRTEIGKTMLGGVLTMGAILLTKEIEKEDIIRTKAWTFVSKLIPRF